MATVDRGLWCSDDHGAVWQKVADKGPSEMIQEPLGPKAVGRVVDGTVRVRRDVGRIR